MGIQIIESAGASIPARRTHVDRFTHKVVDISAQSRTSRSFVTAIRADIGESEAYKQALLRGEIGLQRPLGSNLPGVDFITAVRNKVTNLIEIVCTDVKSTQVGRFPAPKKTMPGGWTNEVHAAVAPSRLKLQLVITAVTGPSPHGVAIASTPSELSSLESEIIQAAHQNRIRLRQLNANYSPAGQGTIVGW
jgi:hypothetical protein